MKAPALSALSAKNRQLQKKNSCSFKGLKKLPTVNFGGQSCLRFRLLHRWHQEHPILFRAELTRANLPLPNPNACATRPTLKFSLWELRPDHELGCFENFTGTIDKVRRCRHADHDRNARQDRST